MGIKWVRIISRILFVAVLFLGFSGQLSAAQLDVIDLQHRGGNRVLTITGPIEEGLYRQVVEKIKRRGVPDVVLMSSSGGDLTEAMLVGRLFRGLFVVVLPKVSSPDMPNECNSACAAIVLSSRTYGATADVIGLHRPYFDASLYAGLSISDARNNYQRLEKEFREYLLEMGVKQHVIDKIMSKSSKEAWYVSLEDFIQENGQPPYIQEWLLARCPGNESNNPKCIDEATSVARKSYLKEMPGLEGIH